MAPEDDQERAWPAGSVIIIIVLLNVAEMHTTPCGTTRFSRFFLNSFLRLADLVAAAAAPVCSCGSFATFHPVRFPGESPGRLLIYFRVAIFFAATAPLRGPLRVRALVCVRCPRTGKLRRWRIPR